jgi:hypothetical protein
MGQQKRLDITHGQRENDKTAGIFYTLVSGKAVLSLCHAWCKREYGEHTMNCNLRDHPREAFLG